MARQLNLLATGQIIPTALHQEMARSYLEYAMSVIVGRALPDVRDGLKPVHRRILYAMHELGLTPDRPFRKCARVVGDVLGKYHPHGDQAVYDALVRMVQEFSSRYPLLAGHGNFGSVDNDPAAAMRYTETRLSPIGHHAVLSEISEAIVDFSSNFDNSQQEPVVLPAQLPLLLLNGCAGIAVGMATNIPPHNLGEVVDGLIALIDNPELPDEKLWEIIPGPDFPTGGEITEVEGIRDAYRTGRGLIRVRGVVKREKIYLEGRRPKERTALVVTELPYQVNKSAWIEKVAELVNQGKLEGIGDIRDESDRSGMRVVIELKREVKASEVLTALYQHTALQTNFGAILLALVDNKPCQLSLRQLLVEFLHFREETLTRQYRDDLQKARQRLHLLTGLGIALNNLDVAIDILRNAPDGSLAKLRLQEQLDITEVQAEAILAMPMRRLTGLERQKLDGECQELQGRIQELETLLGNRHEFMKVLKKELRSLKRQFGDERRTRIVTQVEQKSKVKVPSAKVAAPSAKVEAPSAKVEAPSSKVAAPNSKVAAPNSEGEARKLKLFTPQLPPEDALIEVTDRGEIYWRDAHTPKAEDFVTYSQTVGKQEQLTAITDGGKAYPISVQEIPPLEQEPIHLSTLLPKSVQQRRESPINCFFLPQGQKTLELLLLTQKGRIKRLLPSELADLSQRGLSLIKLKEDDRLGYACLAEDGQEVAIATTGGRILRFALQDEQLPIMGRSAQGNPALRLRYGEQLVGCITLTADDHLLLVSQLGYAKRLPVAALRLAKLGEIGTQALQFTTKTDNLAGMILAKPESEIMVLTNLERRIILSVEAVSLWGKDGPGDLIVKLKPEEEILSIKSY